MKNGKMIKKTVAGMLALIMLVMLCSCGKKGKYSEALSLFDAGQYAEAQVIFNELEDYEDSAEKSVECDYQMALTQLGEKQYDAAIGIFEKLGDYKESAAKLEEAKHEQMMTTYSEEIALLEKDWWVTNGGTENSSDYYEFRNGTAKIWNVWFDGNGKHQGEAKENQPYTINETTINTQTPDGEPLEIAYTVSDGKIVLDDGAFFSPDMVKEGVQGFWKYKYFNYNPTFKLYERGEHNIKIDGDTMTYEYAALAVDYVSYNYFGPWTGPFQVNDGSLDGELAGDQYNKSANTWFFNIIDGKVAVFYYNHACERGDSLPGKNGYMDLIP